MDQKPSREQYSRLDYLTPSMVVANLLRLSLAHVLLIAWFYFSFIYLPLPLYLVLSLFACLIHQRELSEWIHEASHHNLHSSKKWNDILIHPLAGYFFANDIRVHRAGHNKHHREQDFYHDGDPDTWMLDLSSKKQLIKEVFQDLSGISALKMFFQRSPQVNLVNKRTPLFLLKVAIFQLIILASLWAIGRLEIYPIYYISLVCLYPLLNRIRSYGQHVFLQKDGNAYLNRSEASRTIDAGFFDRVLFTSELMMYHYEHHLYPDLPFRAIKKMSIVYDDQNRYSTKRFFFLRKLYQSLL